MLKINKICFLWQGGVAPSWLCHALRLSSSQKLSIRALFWGIVFFFTTNSYFRILKKTGGNIFLSFSSFWEIVEIILFRKFSSSLFQYSERTIAITETNDTSAETPWSQLSFDSLKVGVASSGRRHACSPRKAFFVEFYGREGFLTSCLLWPL